MNHVTLPSFCDDPEIQMPPPESNLKLSHREKAIIIKWIEQGAEWKEHWAFLPPEKKVASPKSVSQYTNEIDQFILFFLQRRIKELAAGNNLETREGKKKQEKQKPKNVLSRLI